MRFRTSGIPRRAFRNSRKCRCRILSVRLPVHHRDRHRCEPPTAPFERPGERHAKVPGGGRCRIGSRLSRQGVGGTTDYCDDGGVSPGKRPGDQSLGTFRVRCAAHVERSDAELAGSLEERDRSSIGRGGGHDRGVDQNRDGGKPRKIAGSRARWPWRNPRGRQTSVLSDGRQNGRLQNRSAFPLSRMAYPRRSVPW